MSHADSVTQVMDAPQHLCIPRLLQDQATRTPDALAILAPGRTPLTYGRLQRHIEDIVQMLHAMGLGRNDRVALVLPNGPEMAVAFLAVAAGMTCVPLNPAYSTSEFGFYPAELRPKALIVQAGMDSPARAVAQASSLPIIELSPVLGAEAGLFTLTGEVHRRIVPREFAQPDDVGLVLHTTGTTSQPKIVPLTHTNICAEAYNNWVALGLVARDRCLNVLPLFHTYGLIGTILASLVGGASVVCTPGFDAPRFFAWLAEFRPTWYPAAPTIHQAILAHAPLHHEIIARCPLRFIRSGSAALPPQVRAELERLFNVPVIETYGMTETSIITCNPPPQRQRKSGSVGMAAGPEVAITDEGGVLLPTGEIGEIVVRGAAIMQGYDNNPAANGLAFRHGWFRTGDQGYLDAEGYLFITGRVKEIINRGGETIAPQEVDDVLMEHPAVAQAVTFGVPHARLGEDIAVAVVLHPNAVATTSDIRRFAAMRLAAYKVPQQVFIVDDLPKGATGKLQRLGLAEKLGLTRPDRVRHAMSAGADAPRTPAEKALAGLWAQVLGLDCVGIHDNFFAIGGDSILATQLISRVREVMRVEISFRSFFEIPTVAGMARNIEALSQTLPGAQVPPLQAVPRDGPLPLSYAQQRLWFLEQLEPSRAVYNLPLAWRFTGDLNVAALKQSLDDMVRRHEILRTTFPSVDGEAVQVITPELDLPLPVVDLRAFPPSAREAAVQRLVTEEAQRPFDLARGPLVRTALLHVSGEEHVLLVALHHIIFDGWSVEIFWRELATLYTAICTVPPLSLPALPLQYADFAVWQREWLEGEVLEAQLAYWKQRLGDIVPVLDLPTDRPRPLVQTFQGARQALMLPTSLAGGLKALSQREGVTLFMTLVAAFQTLLFRYTGQTDLVVGTPVAGRTRVETEGLLGFFVNTLVLRTDLSGNPRLCELLRRVRVVTLGAYDHQDLPFEKLVEALHPTRDLSHHPLVQVMIALQPSPSSVTELPGLTARPVEVDCGTAKFELTLSLQDTEQGLLAAVEYNSDLFARDTITRMLGHFQILLESIIANPEQRLDALPLLTAAERQQLVVEWSKAAAAHPPHTCLHMLFEAQAERTPDVVAVVCDGQQFSYKALNERANQLAHHLRAFGVGPEVCVGLCVERSVETVVGILGILKAGGAYVPLDPDLPNERLAGMMADARVSVLLTQQRCMAALPAHLAQVVCLDSEWNRIAQQGIANLVSGVTPENLAYVIYTSGSTGTPKGVMIEHRQVVAFLHGFEHIAPGGEGSIGTTVCPFGFDVSVWEYFSILCFGGTLHVVPPEIATAPEQFARYLVTRRITSAYIPPALLSDIAGHLEQQPAPIALGRLLVGVEPIQQGMLQRFRNLSEQMYIVNGYGPTEATVCATLYPFRAATESDHRTPIGTRTPGHEVYLVDAGMQPAPIGIPGELLIGGAGLARGYINHPELTAEHFILHPFSAVPGARLYKTGDLARYLPDGNLEFLGRRDQQVKIRGYRIELEEIEAALRQHPAVREAVVLAREDVQPRDRRLVAYVVANQEPAPTSRTLRAFLQQKLPAYMAPSSFVILEAFPRTVNGKLDRQALPTPETTPPLSAAIFVAPRTPVESILASIWADVLGLERVGVHDNFFELGGDSIRGIQVVARANRAGLRLIPKSLFQHQTIAELAAVAGTLPAIQAEPSPVTGEIPGMPVQHGFFAQELPEAHIKNIEAIYPLSPMQQGILFHTLYASEPGVYCAQWTCTLHGHLDVSAFKRAWQRVVDRHPVLRTAFYWEAQNEPFQIVYRHVELPWRWRDWQRLSAPEQERQLEAFLREDLARGFELAKAPLIRLTLLQLAEGTYQCVWSLHHLLLDAWSLPLLLQEVFQLYDALCAGRELHLNVSRPYGDYIAWLQQQDLSHAEAFWRKALKGFIAPTVLDVGPAHGSASGHQDGYDQQQRLLSAAATAALHEFAQQHHLSVNTLVQGAWALLLNRYSGQEDVVFGATVAGRPAELAGIESMIGLFINTLPVRVQVSPDTLLIPWLQELQRQQAEARQYDYSPLVQVHGWSDVPRGLPLFDSLLVFENYPTRTALQERSGSLKLRHVRFTSSTHYPLTVVAVPGSELSLRIKYHCDRFDTAAITRMLGHLQTLLEGMVADPARRLTDLPMLTAAERHQLLAAWNHTSTGYPRDTCLHQAFEAQVARTPDAVAVVFKDQALTYQELNSRANQVAHHLQALGVGPEVRVGIYVERSLETVVGLLGILKAGGAYVPLDPAYPPERLTFIVRDAQVAVLLTQQRLIAGLTEPQTQVVCLDTDWKLIAQESGTNPVNDVAPDNLVYVIYTSGSTGVPKGVAVEHRQLCNYLHGILKCLALPNAASFATVSSLAADFGNTMVFAALCTGGCLHVLSQERVADPKAMAEYVNCHAIDCLKIVPSHLATLQTSPDSESILPRRLLILGGEASRSDWVENLRAMAPGCAILNHYGPTETTVGVLTYRVEEHTHAPMTSTLRLGRPLANVRIYLLDQHLHPIPIGVTGELHIGGAGLARGYLNQPGLTAERFIPNPFSDLPGARLYKTGDLARYLPDGNLEFLGRLDNQVKIRGYRVELEEVEATLEQHQAIRQAVVVAREDASGDRRLVAYCVPHDGCRPDIRELRGFLHIKLPDYMVPAAFVVLDALPLTPNGKVDRQALPAPDQARPRLFETFVAPRTPIEELLVGIWASVLGVEAVGIHDNFFSLGGHSLLAMQVMSRLRKTFEVDVPLRALFDAPTVAGMARGVEQARQALQHAAAPSLNAMPQAGPIPLTMTQEQLWGLDRLLPGAPFSNMPYAVHLTGACNATALEQSFNEIIKRHAALRTTFTTVAGQPVQIIAPTPYLPLPVEDLGALPQAERETTAQRFIRVEALYPFDLENGPLLQVRLLRLDEQEHILLLTMHHIISDGWSKGVLLRELSVLYNAFCQGKPSPLPELAIQYTDYAHWQRQWLDSEAGKAQLVYWTEQLRDPLPILELPTDRPPTEELSLHTGRHPFQISRELTAALTRLSRQETTTLFITLMAAFKMLLYSYTGQEDLRVGTLVANRQYQETEGLIGLLANVVIIRTHLDENLSLRQVLQRVRTTTLHAYAHQELPFEYLARELVRARQLDRLSLFQAMFVMQNASQYTLELPGVHLEVLEVHPLEASACALAVSVSENPQGLDGLCIYKTAFFDATTITRIFEDYQQILEHLIAQPELRLSSLHVRGGV
jgi:amino acid adenylation domain-containing protein